MDIKIDAGTTIVFDLDDTLYKEIDFLRSAYKKIAQTIDGANWHGTFGYMFALYREGQNVFDIISKEYAVEINELINQYRAHIPSISLADGAWDLINAIKQKQGKIAILTDGRSRTQMNKIEALGLEKIVDRIFISEDLGTEKPHKNNFKAVENYFASHNYVYIADNLRKDFITPNERQWQTIGLIDNGLNIHFSSNFYREQLHSPHHWIMTLNDLKVISSNNL